METYHPGTPCNSKVAEYCGEIPLLDGKWGFQSPQKLEIELTRQCNLNCIHCWNNSSRDRPKIPYHLIRREIESFSGTDIKFTGGEPVMYDSFINLLKICDGKNIEITSNGTLIGGNLVNILKMYSVRVNISLHGSTEKIHEAITRTEGSYRDSINAIKALQDEGINPVINYTVMGKNIGDVENMIQLVRSMGVGSLRFSVLRNCGRGKSLEVLSREEIFELRKIIKGNSQSGIEFERSELYPSGYFKGINDSLFYGCGGMRNQVYISSSGEVYPCSLSSEIVGNINSNSLLEIWNNKRASEFRKKLICPNTDCSLKERCAGKCKA